MPTVLVGVLRFTEVVGFFSRDGAVCTSLVGVPVDIWRDVLRREDDGGGNVDERVYPHHHRVHRRTLRRHLSSNARQDHVDAIASRQDDGRRLDRRRRLLDTHLDPVRRHLPAGRRRASDRRVGAVQHPSGHGAPAALLRGVERRLLHHSDDHYQRPLRAHRMLHTAFDARPC